MSDNHEYDNQDFIEQADEFAEVMDDNFESPADPMAADHIIDSDSLDEPFEFENEWEDDFENEEAEEAFVDPEPDPDMMAMSQKPSKNWFNIAMFGGTAIVMLGMVYSYFPGILGGTTSAPVQPGYADTAVQNQDLSVSNSADNALMAQQALQMNGDTEPESSLFDNPDIIGDGVTSIERADPDAEDNKIFEALGHVPEMSENDVNDIFAALEEVEKPQELPVPADEENLLNSVDEIVDVLPNIIQDQPRSPAVDDVMPISTGVSQMADAVILDDSIIAGNQGNTAVDGTQVTALNERMDLMMARIESLATAVEGLSDAEPIFAPATGEGRDVARLEQTIQALEKRVEGLSKKKSVSKPKKKTVSSKKKTTKKRKTVAHKKTNWVLRGASPGQAFVAERGTQNLRTLSVGDRLSGIGRIQSIAKESGRWVLRGTSGRLTQ